jgi:aryl-alcohol dehydrogenase-like predicted oxidoreductase
MNYLKLGSTGLDVSPIRLGGMNFGEPRRGGDPWTVDESANGYVVERAVAAGINFFDPANTYSAGSGEEILGALLRDRAVVQRVREIADEIGVPRAQVALAWLRQQPAVTAPVVGATSVRRLDDALGCLSVTLTDDHLRRLAEPYVPHPVVGHE